MDTRELPDDVIFHIFSFLPLKSSVRTSILAKAWRFKWVTSPSLGFTCNHNFGECCSSRNSKIQQQQINHKNSPNIFHRGSSNTDHNRDFESWITSLFACRDIRNLVISPMNYRLRLPPSLFSNETLVYLSILNCQGFIPEGVAVHFPALKELQLINVGYESPASLRHLYRQGFQLIRDRYESPASLQHILSGCPVIEELTIQKMKAFCCDIRVAPNLTRLVIDINEVFYVHLVAPKLRYLRICVRKAKCVTALPLVSLIKADVNLAHESNKFYAYFVIKFVSRLFNVECLTLSTRRLEVPDSHFNNWVVKFRNLIKLKLRADWRFITLLLENADNLRVLTILPMVDRNSTPYWKQPKRVPECLKSSLEKLKLIDFEWSSEHAFDMIKYILKNSKLLGEIKITCTTDYKVKFAAAVERLATMKMRSMKCYLKFVPRFRSFVNIKEYPLY